MSDTITSSDMTDSDKPIFVDSAKIENIKSDINLKGMLMTQTWTEMASLMSKYQAELVSWESRLLISHAKAEPSAQPSEDVSELQILKNKLRRCEAQLEQCEQRLQLSQHNLIKQTEQVMKLQTQVTEHSEKNVQLNTQVTKLNLQLEIYKKKKLNKKKKKEEERQAESIPVEPSSREAESAEPPSPPDNGELVIDESFSIKEEIVESDDPSNRTNSDIPVFTLQSGSESPFYITSLIDYEENESQSPDDVTMPLYSLEPIKIKQEPNANKRKRSSKKKEGPECPVCSKSCGNEAQLQQHMLLHSKDRPFMCQDCGWRFQRRENLIAHERVHSGERPYKCEQCCRAFTQISARRRHQKTAHGAQPEKKIAKINDFSTSITEILSNIEIIPAIDPDSSTSRPEVETSPPQGSVSP